MEVAHIVPTNYLNPLKNTFTSNFYMVLAHQVVEDSKYYNFFRKRREEGAFIILDNSAFEFGNAIDDKFLLKAISLISPSEFILPDVLFEKDKTIKRVKTFLKRISDEKINLMAVPQGKDMNEWIECYLSLITIPQIKSIGIGAIYVNNDNFKLDSNLQSGREIIFNQLEKREILDKTKNYHLLGLSDSGHLEIDSLKKYPYIRSVDSSAAFIHGKDGYSFNLTEQYKKSKKRINFRQKYSSENLDIIKHNIKTLDDIAH